MSQSNSSDASAPPSQVKAAQGQPKGLWVLFITEMWERFSYYGMRALLVIYLVSKLTAENPGFGWSEKTGQLLLAFFAMSAYFAPLFGGWLADKFLGTHRSLLIGGWIMAIGQALLFFTEYWGYKPGVEVVTFFSAPAPFLTFMIGLILIIVGTGLFKPCVSVMVGQLYGADDPRRDSGFTIFYMGINVGALLSTLVAGTIGETCGWHWGFGSAAVGMILGLTVYQIVRPFYLKGIGLPPHHKAEHEEGYEPTPEEIKQAETDEYERTRPLTRIDWDRMIVIVVLAVFGIVFWVAFEQAASSLNLFAFNRTDRNVLGFEIPATWYQSVNPFAIVVLAPLFAGLWAWLDKRKLQPSTPVKFGLGLALLSLGYIPMLLASLECGNPVSTKLVNAPEAVQTALEPIHNRLVDEKKAKQEQDKKEGKDLEHKKSGKVEEPKVEKGAEFELFEELTDNDTKYYAVAYSDTRASVYELYDAKGNLLRRHATRKEDNKKKKDQEVIKDKKPKDIALAEVPEAARKVLQEEVSEHKIENLQSVVKNKERAFAAKWTASEGEIAICVGPDGLVLNKTNKAFERVGLAGPQWLLLMYLLATCGELCLSPISLSMVTKLSPARYTSLMMGLFFTSFAAANFIAHTLAAYSKDIGSANWFWGGQIDFFLVLAVAPAIISVIVFLISPMIKRMMHGLH